MSTLTKLQVAQERLATLYQAQQTTLMAGSVANLL